MLTSRGTTESTTRLGRLTALRYPAALAVVVFHFNRGRLTPGVPLLHLGREAVVVFFVLSGLVLTWGARTSGSPSTGPQFVARRIARIWPAHVAVLVAAVVIDVARHTPPRRLIVVLQALLLQSWFPTLAGQNRASDVSWSLSCELAFYVAFPWLVRLLPRTPRSLAAVVGGCVLLAYGVRFVAVGTGSTSALSWATLFPPARLPEFVAGMALGALLADAVGRREPQRWVSVLAAVPWPIIAALGVAFTWRADHPGAWQLAGVDAFVPALALLTWAGARDLSGRPSPLLHNGVAQRLGAVSFCLYLVHVPMIRAFDLIARALGHPGAFMVLGWWFPPVAVVFACSATLVAALVHELVERPAERWLREGADRRLGVPRTPAPIDGRVNPGADDSGQRTSAGRAGRSVEPEHR